MGNAPIQSGSMRALGSRVSDTPSASIAALSTPQASIPKFSKLRLGVLRASDVSEGPIDKTSPAGDGRESLDSSAALCSGPIGPKALRHQNVPYIKIKKPTKKLK